jgi:hypothetical protein
MMKSSIRLLAAVVAGALFLGTNAFAQGMRSEAGLLGKSHAGFDFTYVDHTGSKLNKARGASADFNVPVNAKVDFGFAYDYSYVSGQNYSVTGSALSASLLTFNRTEYGKTYLVGSLGHAWDRVKMPGGFSGRENGALWALRAGCETPLSNQTAVNASLGFADAFNGRTTRNPTLEFRVEANHWFSPEVAGVLSAAYQQIKRMPDAALYTAGLRWAF